MTWTLLQNLPINSYLRKIVKHFFCQAENRAINIRFFIQVPGNIRWATKNLTYRSFNRNVPTVPLPYLWSSCSRAREQRKPWPPARGPHQGSPPLQTPPLQGAPAGQTPPVPNTEFSGHKIMKDHILTLKIISLLWAACIQFFDFWRRKKFVQFWWKKLFA